jgi:multidrug efflux pump subunit AcrA (membrane-fusion protein)
LIQNFWKKKKKKKMKKIDRRIIIVIAFVFIVGMSYGIMKFLIAQKEEPPVRQASNIKRYVTTERVVYSTLLSPIEESGRLNSFAEFDVVAEASGKILPGKVSLKKGAAFRKGELLFSIYSDEAVLSLRARKSQFMNSLANILPDIRIDYPEYESDFMKFFNTIDLSKDLPDLPLPENGKLKIFLASRSILSDYYAIQKDELQLSRYNIFAPFNGSFSEVYMEAGAYTNAGGKVARAIQTDKLELEIPVKRDDAKWIKIGSEVPVFRSDDALGWKGRVIRKGEFIGADTQTQTVYIQVENPANKALMNGEYLVAKFPGYPIENAMEIPRKSVFNYNEVYVVVNDRLEKRTIDIIKVNEKSLIFRGVEEDALLVTQALINVQEGVMVTTVKEVGPGKGMGQANGNEKGVGNSENTAAQAGETPQKKKTSSDNK